MLALDSRIVSSGSAIAGDSIWSMFISLLDALDLRLYRFNDRFRYIDVATTSPSWRWTLTITVVRTCPVFHSRGWQMLWAICGMLGLMDF